MNVKKRGNALKFLLMAIVLFSLVGCTTSGFDTNEMVRAPQLSKEYSKLVKLIEQKEGKEVFLKRPQTLTDTENSAIKMKDDLAIVSFNCTGDVDDCIAFFKKENDTWTLLDALTKTSRQVDSIRLVDFEGDGHQKFVVSWSNSNLHKATISVYDDKGKCIDSINNDTGTLYKDFTLCDINGDGRVEVIGFFSKVISERKEIARVYSFNEKFSLISECNIREHMKYFAITVGNIDDKHKGIFLDGDFYDSNEYFCTDAVFWNDGKLEPVRDEFFRMSQRFSNERSRDIDEDGIIEVPSVGEIYDVEKYGYKKLGIFFAWKKWSSSDNQATIVKNKSHIYNNLIRYSVMIPDSWIDSSGDSTVISLIDNNDEKSMVFQMKQDNTPLFEIKAFTTDDWKNVDSNLYKQITTREKDNLVFAVRYLSNNNFVIPLEELKKRFVFS